MRGKYRRRLNFEAFESRIALSAAPGGGSCDEAVALFANSVSSQAYVAADNSVESARDLGAIDGPTSFTDEHVGQFDARDIYRFQLSAPGSTLVYVHELTADADVYLLDTDRLTLAKSVNWGTESELIQMNLPIGEYFIVVQNYSPWSSASYSLDVSTLRDAQPDLAGNTFDSAFEIGELESSQTFTDYVGDEDNADIFHLQIDASVHVNVELTSLSEDVDLYLVSDDQFRVGESQESGSSSEGIDAWLSPGSYYVMVVPHGPVNSDYELHISSTSSLPGQPSTLDPIIFQQPTPEPNPPEPPSLHAPDKGPLAEVSYFGGAQDWGVNAVSAPEAWNVGYTGAGVTIAMVDSGVQFEHPDLQNSIWVNVDEIPEDGIDNDGNGYVDDRFGWDFVDGDGTPTDENGHGTQVAGIVAAENNGFGATGVAYGAQLMLLRVLDDKGNGSNFDVASAIRYAVDNEADIVTLSLGGGNSSSIFSALRYAQQHDVLVIAASGNDGANLPDYPARHSGTLDNVLSVGAFDSSYQLASFSNRVGVSSTVQVDAPGVGVYSTLTNDRYGYVAGTSMAVPSVAGVAALTLSAAPHLTAVELRNVLTKGAIDSVDNSDAIGGIDASVTIPLANGATLAEITSAGIPTPPTLTDPASDEFGLELNTPLRRRSRSVAL